MTPREFYATDQYEVLATDCRHATARVDAILEKLEGECPAGDGATWCVMANGFPRIVMYRVDGE